MVLIPKYVTRYFWGDDLSELSVKKHKKYIAKTVLGKGDGRAARWLLKMIGKKNLRMMLTQLKLDKKSANFWKLYLS